MGRDEENGNFDENFEWDCAAEGWIPSDRMLLNRGHASSSTIAANCGFLVAGGSSNGMGKIRYCYKCDAGLADAIVAQFLYIEDPC